MTDSSLTRGTCIGMTFSPSHWTHVSVSESGAAGQNSELNKLTVLQTRHIYYHCVPFRIGFGSVIPEVLAKALSDTNTLSVLHNKKLHHENMSM